jgi:hypothetical protein
MPKCFSPYEERVMSPRRANMQAKQDVNYRERLAPVALLQTENPVDTQLPANSASIVLDLFASNPVIATDIAAVPHSADAVALQVSKTTHQLLLARSDSVMVADVGADPDAVDAVSLQSAESTDPLLAASSESVALGSFAADSAMVAEVVAGPDLVDGAAVAALADAGVSAKSKRSPRFPQQPASLGDDCGMGDKPRVSLNSPVLTPLPQPSSDTPPERQQPKRKQVRKRRSRNSWSDHFWPGAGPKEKAEMRPRPAVQRWYTPGEKSVLPTLQDLYSIEDLRRVTEEIGAMIEVHGTAPAGPGRVPQDRPSRQIRSEQEPGGDDGKGEEAWEGGPGP